MWPSGPPPLTSTAAERKSLSPGEYETDVYPDTEWAVHLVTRHQVIFGWLDGRQIDSAGAGSDSPAAAPSSSSSFSSSNFAENSIVEQLDDYAAILDYITSNLTFVRTAASCLYGSNIGGSLVLLTLSSSPSTSAAFNCGLVLSPVVEWRSVSKCLKNVVFKKVLRFIKIANYIFFQTPCWRSSTSTGSASPQWPTSPTCCAPTSTTVSSIVGRSLWRPARPMVTGNLIDKKKDFFNTLFNIIFSFPPPPPHFRTGAPLQQPPPAARPVADDDEDDKNKNSNGKRLRQLHCGGARAVARRRPPL